MQFAQAFRRHLSPDLTPLPIAKLKNIIAQFLDNKEAQFSIQNIAKLAIQDFKFPPGQWYNPSQICYCLQTLHDNNKNAIQDCANLEIVIFQDGMIFWDQIEKKLMGNQGIQNKAILAILMSQIGLDVVNSKYLNIVKLLFDFPTFNGMIGGKTHDYALFFLGKKNEQDFIYLDPHYTQKTMNSSELDSKLHQYFPQNSFLYPINTINPSICLSFYLRDYDEAKRFYLQMNEMKNKWNDQVFFGVEQITPEVVVDLFLSLHKFNEEEIEVNQIEQQNLSDEWEMISK